MISGSETTARPTHYRNIQVLDGVYHIPPETVLVGKRVTGIINTAIYLIVKMFDEIAEHHRVVLYPIRPGLHDGGVLGCGERAGGQNQGGYQKNLSHSINYVGLSIC